MYECSYLGNMYKTESCSNRVESGKCGLATKMTEYIDTREERKGEMM